MSENEIVFELQKSVFFHRPVLKAFVSSSLFSEEPYDAFSNCC